MWYFGDGSPDSQRRFPRQEVTQRASEQAPSTSRRQNRAKRGSQPLTSTTKELASRSDAASYATMAESCDASVALRCLLRMPPPPPTEPPPPLLENSIEHPPPPRCPTAGKDVKRLELETMLIDRPGPNEASEGQIGAVHLSTTPQCFPGLQAELPSDSHFAKVGQSSFPCHELERTMFEKRSLIEKMNDHSESSHSPSCHFHSVAQSLPPLSSVISHQDVSMDSYARMHPILEPFRAPQSTTALQWTAESSSWQSTCYGFDPVAIEHSSAYGFHGLGFDLGASSNETGHDSICDTSFEMGRAYSTFSQLTSDDLDEKLLLSAGSSREAMDSHDYHVLACSPISLLDCGSPENQLLLTDCIGYDCSVGPTLASGGPFMSVSPESCTRAEDPCYAPVDSIAQSMAQDAESDDAHPSIYLGMASSSPQELNRKGALRWADMLDCSEDDLPALPSPCSATFGFADFQKEPDVFSDDAPSTLSPGSQKTKVRKRRRTRSRLNIIAGDIGTFAESDRSCSSLKGAKVDKIVDHTAPTTIFAQDLTELQLLLAAFWCHVKDLSQRVRCDLAPCIEKLSRSPVPIKFRGRFKHSVNADMTKRKGNASSCCQRMQSPLDKYSSDLGQKVVKSLLPSHISALMSTNQIDDQKVVESMLPHHISTRMSTDQIDDQKKVQSMPTSRISTTMSTKQIDDAFNVRRLILTHVTRYNARLGMAVLQGDVVS